MNESLEITPLDGYEKLLGTYEICLTNWRGQSILRFPGRVFHLSRKTLNATKNIKALKQCGVYLLYGITANSHGELFYNIYVGQANVRKNGEAVLGRIKEHDNPKEMYWSEAMAFVDRDNRWSGTAISYLENRFTTLIQNAKDKSKRYVIQNKNEPNLGFVPQDTIDRMEQYLEGFIKLLQIIGVDLFEKEEDPHNVDDPDLPFTHQTENGGNPNEFPFKIGQVMSFAFRDALEKGLLKEDIKFLKSEEAGRIFKTRGHRVITSGKKPSKDASGINRFSAKPAYYEGKTYWITTQVYSEGLETLLSYLDKHGMSRENVIALCQKGCQKEKTKAQTPLWKTKQSAWWTAFMEYAMQDVDFTQHFNRRKPQPQQWIGLPSGSAKCQISLTVTKKRLGVELYIHKSKDLFNALLVNKNTIENELGFQLDWQALQGRKASRIAVYLPGDYTGLNASDDYFKWYCEKAVAIKRVFSGYLD